MRQLIRTYSITGAHQITVTGYSFTKQDIRLIINETLASSATTDVELVASVLVSSTKKDNVTSVQSGVITLASTTANLTVGDELTIEIDIDNVAKQGTDPSVTLTSVDEKIDDFYDTFDADIASQLYECIGEEENEESEEEELEEASPSQSEALLSRLRTLLESYDELAENNTTLINALNSLTNANILHPNMDGITFVNEEETDNGAILLLQEPTNISSITSTVPQRINQYRFYNCTSLQTIDLPNVTTIGSYAFYGCTGLQSINLPNVESVGTGTFQNTTSLREISLPNLRSAGSNVFRSTGNLLKCSLPSASYFVLDMFTGSAIRELYVPHVNSFLNDINPFSSCNNLIDITIGEDFAGSINFRSWNPTNAYSTTYNTLVPTNILEEHPSWKNLDYLLYCIREHFAANLPDITGQTSLTIRFYTTLKNHITNSQATMDAFTVKGWTIA